MGHAKIYSVIIAGNILGMATVAGFWIHLLGLLLLGLLNLGWVPPALAVSPAEGVSAEVNLDLETKNFAGQVLIDQRFTKLELEGANFAGADLRGTVFNSTDLTGANLRGINFENGMAYHTILRRADLSDAILVNTFLLQSRFDDAIVTNADFKDAVLDLQEKIKLCKTASGRNPVTGRDTRKSLGC
jgi:hypothetical protein